MAALATVNGGGGMGAAHSTWFAMSGWFVYVSLPRAMETTRRPRPAPCTTAGASLRSFAASTSTRSRSSDLCPRSPCTATVDESRHPLRALAGGSIDAAENSICARPGAVAGARRCRCTGLRAPRLGRLLRLSSVPRDGLALWVQPGAEQDRLRARGDLLPAGFPDPRLPRRERSTPGWPCSHPAPVRVRPGGRWTTTVEVVHPGRSSPVARPRQLPPSRPGGGRRPPHGTGTGRRGTTGSLSTFTAELPAWSHPGDRFVVDIPTVAVDGRLRPLPPGSYDLHVGLAQVGFGEFDRGVAVPLNVGVTVG